MSVNTMNFQQASELLTSLHEQATGQSAIVPTSLEDFVSMAQTTLRCGYDPVMNAISQVLRKTIVSVRPYERKFAGLNMTGDRWGAVVRKLNFVEGKPEDEQAYNIEDGTLSGPIPMKKPKVIETHFYGENIYSDIYTITEKQLTNAFKSYDAFNEFMSGLTTHFSNQREQWLEEMTRSGVANFIGAKITADGENANGQVLHLLTEYNAETGLSLDSQTVRQPENFTPFIRWMFGRLNTLARKMGERSELFQQKLDMGHIMRHTPARDLKAYMLAEFKDQIDAQAMSTTYNENYLSMADNEGVSYWQAIENPDEIKITPAYIGSDGAIKTASEVVAENVIGVFFDRDAIGYNIYDDTIASSPYDALHRVYNLVPHVEIQMMNDITEKGVVLMLD